MAKLEAMLEQRGIASPREMSEAVARCQLHGGDLTTSLLQFVSADEAELSAALSECYGLPAAIVGVLPEPDEAALKALPREVAERYCCVPLEARPGELVLAVARPFEAALKEELSFALGLNIDERVALEVRIRQAISRYYGLPLSARNQRGIARLDGELDGATHETPLGLWPETQLSALPRPPSDRPPRSDAPRPASERPASRSDAPRLVSSVPPSSGTRTSRRRGPMSLELAREELGRSSSPSEVLDAFFGFACQFFEYSVLFAVHNSLAEGLNAWGPGADREAVQGIGVPLDLPSSLSEAAESCTLRLTRLGNEGIDRTLAADLRRPPRARVLLLPVCLRRRCAVLLYADNGVADVVEHEIGDVVAIAPDVANALGRIIVQRKLESAARQVPVDTAELSESLSPARQPAPGPSASRSAAASPGSGLDHPDAGVAFPTIPNKNRDKSRSNARSGSKPNVSPTPLGPERREVRQEVAAPSQPAPEPEPTRTAAADAEEAPARQGGEAERATSTTEGELAVEAAIETEPVATLDDGAEEPGADPSLEATTAADPVFLLARPTSKRRDTLPTPDPVLPHVAKPPVAITRPAPTTASRPRLPSVIVDPSAVDAVATARASAAFRAAAITRAPSLPRHPAAQRRQDVPPPAEAPRPPTAPALPRARPLDPSSPPAAASANTAATNTASVSTASANTASANTASANTASANTASANTAVTAPVAATNTAATDTAPVAATNTAATNTAATLAPAPKPVAASAPAVPVISARASAPKPAPAPTLPAGPRRSAEPSAPRPPKASVPLQGTAAASSHGADAGRPITASIPIVISAPIPKASSPVALTERAVRSPAPVASERLGRSPSPSQRATARPARGATPSDKAAADATPPRSPVATHAARSAGSAPPRSPVAAQAAPPVGASQAAPSASAIRNAAPSVPTAAATSTPNTGAPSKTPGEGAPRPRASTPAPGAAATPAAAAPVAAPVAAPRAALPPGSGPYPALAVSSAATVLPPPPDAEIEGLVELLCQGNSKAVQDVTRIGPASLPQLMARFPGPVISERVGPSSRASECGPLLQALAAIGSAATPDITKSSEDRDASVRRWATLLLGELPGPEACRAVVQRLADEVPRVHQAALDAARLLLGSSAADLFRKTLFEVAEAEDAPLTLRLRTLEHVAKLRDSASVPRLIAFLATDPEPIVHKALWALSVVTRQDFGRDTQRWLSWWQAHEPQHRVQWLIDALDHRDPRLRKAAAEELLLEARDSFGYAENLPHQKLLEAKERYRQWWVSVGASRFGRAPGPTNDVY